MIRAGVFIGVDQTGGLQRLFDGANGAANMHAWGIAQGMRAENTKLITDATGKKVTPDDISNAIKGIINGPGVDQLIVYFAGHGVNINRSEHWLLTDAPERSWAAVDVTSSVELARYSGIQHVVVISDACRVAPEGIQAQNVRGVDIFPNDVSGDRAKPVDQFFACLLGRTAAEIRDPLAAARNYSALYTLALLDGLSGKRAELLEPSAADGDLARYVKPRRLQSYLESEIPQRVRARRLERKVNQNPDAIITSDGRWLARIEGVADTQIGGLGDELAADTPTAHRGPVQELTHQAIEGDRKAFEDTVEQLLTSRAPIGVELARTVETVAAPFGPDHFESECGIKVRGTVVLEAFARRAEPELLGSELVRLTNLQDRAVSVVLRVDGGIGTVVPALPGFIAGLTFEAGELVDVAYEPSAGSWRWSMFHERADQLRTLRAVAASSSLHGRFQLEGDDAPNIARSLQLGKGVDPTLAVYAAYAYHDLQHLGRIGRMSDYLREDIGVSLFDVELLARTLVDRRVDASLSVVPFVPLLAQGWSLLRAHRVKIHPLLSDLGSELRDSVWSLYSPAGVNLLNEALATGDLR